MTYVELGPLAENNGFACMLTELLNQNFEAKPHKSGELTHMLGTVAIVADDAEVAVTLVFDGRSIKIHDGIVGKPDITVRGQAEQLMALSTIPLTKRWHLPIPHPRRQDELLLMKEMGRAMKAGLVKTYGMWNHPLFLLRLTRVMSVNG